MNLIAILGGAFDPVTVGHVRLIEMLEREGFDVVCMPCGNRHSFEKQMRPVEDRLDMLRLAIGSRRIALTEIEHGTYRASDTYPLLRKEFGKPYWVIGSDNANCMERWHESERIKNEIPFIVIARAGHPLTADGSWCLKAPHRYFRKGIEGEVSSTQARNAITHGNWEDAEKFVLPQVLRLIRTRAWYQTEKVAVR